MEIFFIQNRYNFVYIYIDIARAFFLMRFKIEPQIRKFPTPETLARNLKKNFVNIIVEYVVSFLVNRFVTIRYFFVAN